MHGRRLLPLLVFLVACQTDLGRDSADEHDKTALMYAAERGDVAETARLLDSGAHIDQSVRPHPSARSLMAFLMFMQDLPERDEGYTALHYAIENRHLNVVKLLLERGADPMGGEGGLSAVQLALLTRQGRDVVELLVAHGASVRPTDGTDPGPLVAAAVMHRDTATLRYLLELGADPNAGNPLANAASWGDSAVVEMLLAAGADPARTDPRNGWTPAMIARDAGHTAIAERLGGGSGSTAQLTVDLGNAITSRDSTAVTELLAQGANPAGVMRTGQPFLAEAVRSGSVPTVRALLEAGASPHIEQYGVPIITLAMQSGDTLMIATLMRHGANVRIPGTATYAAGAGSVQVLQQLRAAGADLRENTDAPLRAAAFGGHAEAARYLLSIGADPNAQDEHELRPIDRAAARGGLEVTRVLLEGGADPNSGPEGWTPLMGAAMSGDTLMMDLLLEFGADPHRRDGEGKNAADYARGAGNGWVPLWLSERASRTGLSGG